MKIYVIVKVYDDYDVSMSILLRSFTTKEKAQKAFSEMVEESKEGKVHDSIDEDTILEYDGFFKGLAEHDYIQYKGSPFTQIELREIEVEE